MRVFSKLVGESKAHDFCGFFYDIDLFVALVHQILDAALDPSTGDDLEPHELWGASYAISQLCLAKIDA